MAERDDAGNNTRRPRGGVGRCPCCGRHVALTFHHLIPKKVHRRNRFRRRARSELSAGVAICRPCHDGIHRAYDEMTLAQSFASLVAIMQDPDLTRHFAWVGRQKKGRFGS